MAPQPTLFPEGVVDREGEHHAWRTVVDGHGAVLVLSGPRAVEGLGVVAGLRSPWVPHALPDVHVALSLHPVAHDPTPTACFSYVPGVSLISLLAQSQAAREPMPVQAVAALLHEVALGAEALRRAFRSTNGAVTAGWLTPFPVRVGFHGEVTVLPTVGLPLPAVDVEADAPPLSPASRWNGVEVIDPCPPEYLMGQLDDGTWLLFELGVLLAAACGTLPVPPPATPFGFLESMYALRKGPPELPSVPEPLRSLARACLCGAATRLTTVFDFNARLRDSFDLADGRVALASFVHRFAAVERESQEAFLREAQHHAPTTPRFERFSPRARVGTLALEADVRPVTQGEFLAFLSQTGAPRPPDFLEGGDPHVPAVRVGSSDAAAFARWRGGRLPTEHEWVMLARERWCRDVGRVWEWTCDRLERGFVVRGGPWRDRLLPGHADNRSWELESAADVGFRVVYDVPA